MCHSDPRNMWLCATEVLCQEDRSRLSMQCESDIKNSYFRSGQQINYSRFQQIQVIFTSQTYESCHPLTCKARILNLPRSIDLNKPPAWEYPLNLFLSRGNQLSSRFKHDPDLRSVGEKYSMKRLLQLPSSRSLPPGSGFLPLGPESMPPGIGPDPLRLRASTNT